jgi:hypothetical protein
MEKYVTVFERLCKDREKFGSVCISLKILFLVSLFPDFRGALFRDHLKMYIPSMQTFTEEKTQM